MFGLLAATPARAATPTKVTADWKGGASLPSDVTMYTYVPSKVATNPPLVTLIHYCGGSATAVFGQASGIVSAADQYGFIMVVPDNGGRCWDVTSSKTHTRDGGGDSHAIKQMVKYAITTYKANADRVYSTGDSSGAMMTELLLALYPDIYKAGCAFAGVPAGCANEFDGSGLCGLSAQTAQQWGDRVRAMYSGYSGHRPRVQLFHGDADATITYKNLAEAIKEWTNVLGLSTDPTSTQTGLTLGTHQASRQSWKNACGYVVLDALTSIGGDHGPSDALFASNYVLPFLGLDSQAAATAAVDPEIAQCSGDGGVPTSDGGGDASKADGSGSGGSGGSSGGSGGSSGSGGSVATGGSNATGGRSGSGGSVATGGSNATGGSAGSGGSSSNGGAPGTGGSQASGGSATGGSPNGTGGAQGSGGAVGTGGKSSAGGSTGSGSGGTPSSGGAGGNSGSGGSTAGGSSGGCGCALGGATSKNRTIMDMALGLALLVLTCRRRRPAHPTSVRSSSGP
jgi:poly(hydroxyalkanoate) depolymerase family esterase